MLTWSLGLSCSHNNEVLSTSTALRFLIALSSSFLQRKMRVVCRVAVLILKVSFVLRAVCRVCICLALSYPTTREYNQIEVAVHTHKTQDYGA